MSLRKPRTTFAADTARACAVAALLLPVALFVLSAFGAVDRPKSSSSGASASYEATP